MKHQNVLRILAIAFAVVMMLVIASCDMLQPEHVHTEVELAAKEATCTETGLTAGKKCSDCGAITVAQQTIPAKGHTEEVVAAVEATCTSIGLTEGKKCSVCDVTLVAQQQVAAKGHTEVDVAAIPATCTQKGLTAGKKCSECDAILVAQELTDALGHTAGDAATCTTAQICTVCKTELVAALGHTWGTEVTTVTAPTCAVAGEGTVKCNNCDATKAEEIPATGNHTWDNGVVTVVPSCAPGQRTYTCTVCQDEKFEAIQATGAHTYGDDFVIYPATCTSEGLKGKTCSTCNVTVKAGKIEALGGEHVYAEGKCTACNACELHSYVDYLAAKAGDAILTDPDNDRFDFQWGICKTCGYVDENHEHLIKGGECYYCDYVYSQVTHRSAVDNDGDGFGDIYYFAPALPERFRAEGTYMIDALNDVKAGKYTTYDEVKSGPGSDYWNGVKSDTPMPYAHIYVNENSADDYILYEIEVEKGGTYEVAIAFRIKDTKLRGSTFTINEGTPSEYSFVYSYGWATEQDYINARNNQKLIGGYMMIEMDLHAGVNTIKITRSTDCPKSQHFRAFFFALKEEKHVHAYAESAVYDEATGTLSVKYTCECGDTQIVPTADKPLTMEEAIAIGITYEKTTYSSEYYYVKVTLDNQVNANGFARGGSGDNILSVAGGYLTGEAEGSIKKGDTVVYKCKIGAVNSATTTSTKEARLFEVEVVAVIPAEETPAQ